MYIADVEDRHGHDARARDGLRHAGGRHGRHHVPAVRRRGAAHELLPDGVSGGGRAVTSGCSSTRCATTATSACSASCGAPRSRSPPTATTRSTSAIRRSTCRARSSAPAITARSPRSIRASRTATTAPPASIAAAASATCRTPRSRVRHRGRGHVHARRSQVREDQRALHQRRGLLPAGDGRAARTAASPASALSHQPAQIEHTKTL